MLGFDGVVGNYASPYTPGSAYVLLHHVLRRGERQERRMGPRHRRHGRDHPGHGQGLRRQGRHNHHRFRGARGAGRQGPRRRRGHRKRAKPSARAMVVSNLNPKLLFQKLVDPAALPADFRERIEHYRGGSGTFRMNVALSEAAALHVPAGGRRSPDRRHHHRADARLYGPRLCRRPRLRLVEGADRRDADPLDAGRQPRAARPACRQPVLPARPARALRRPLLGRSSRGGRRPDDRHRRQDGAGLQGLGARPPDPSRRSTWSAPSAWSAATSSTAR